MGSNVRYGEPFYFLFLHRLLILLCFSFFVREPIKLLGHSQQQRGLLPSSFVEMRWQEDGILWDFREYGGLYVLHHASAFHWLGLLFLGFDCLCSMILLLQDTLDGWYWHGLFGRQQGSSKVGCRQPGGTGETSAADERQGRDFWTCPGAPMREMRNHLQSWTDENT